MNSRGQIATLLRSLHHEYVNTLSRSYIQYPKVLNKHVILKNPSYEQKQMTSCLHHLKRFIIDLWLLNFMHDMLSSPKSTSPKVLHMLVQTWTCEHHYDCIPWMGDPWITISHKKNFCNITNMPRPCFIDNMENKNHPLDCFSFRIGNLQLCNPWTSPLSSSMGNWHQWV
jgi:hypothetical protein